MKTFKTFDEFLKSVIASIENDKDVYVFGYTIDEESDYQLCEEEKDDYYYVTFCLDFNKLQELLHLMHNYVEDNYIIVNDFYNEENEDGEGFTMIKRMHIFKSI